MWHVISTVSGKTRMTKLLQTPLAQSLHMHLNAPAPPPNTVATTNTPKENKNKQKKTRNLRVHRLMPFSTNITQLGTTIETELDTIDKMWRWKKKERIIIIKNTKSLTGLDRASYPVATITPHAPSWYQRQSYSSKGVSVKLIPFITAFA